ncbi:glycosyltransferase family 1 protein [Pedobacter sp. KBW06]|uniref:glycosyltransferase family 4 protein n=1 Tax=Pedobacter sp. KBW06 TaxID=2153359 RepID=UPI000F5A010A|nr:glycosyltransferase family 1 protein [Pedobacter sp. KBW06]RQO72437.1 glycosyltransferase family 1 protein [Pedobacter sp. KBW06]
MNILLDCERLKYPNTGLYTFCESLGTALIKNAAINQHITAYIPITANGIFGERVKYLIQKSWHKLFIPGTSKFDIWHIGNQGSRYYPPKGRVKVLLTIHDLNFLIEKQDRPSRIKQHLDQIQSRINRSSAIVCISHFVLDQVRQHLDVKGKEISVIYNGCTVNEYPEFNMPAFRPSKPFLFSIGTVLPKKNFHVLPVLLQENNYELVIAGNLSSPEYVNKILEEATRLGVKDRVHVIGSITKEERCWYYRNCRAFVFPSIAEGFGLPVIEAMHYGKPVFLSTHTSLPEVGADAAYYFQDFEGEHMQQILNEGLIHFDSNNGSEKAKKRAAQFNWDDTARGYLDLYNSL